MSPAPPAGPITIAGKTVSRLGFGTMHTHGTIHIDTADVRCPHTIEQLVSDALHT
ncbi:hypothetical protein TR631_37740 [Streptomyces rochei]|uniref:hypothetical protein n=1 Tax=Streptomyces rochei group TaxID=2867164 RepID=UPI002176E38B|nr:MULTISPECIES: hypothetical protein [Streptomyces rochei group]WQC10407.1 hypothetical protein TR631_00570 [Streptomyces rochei]WQC17268.1 hypothetical protein TR631_37740 [Streptomyces rochei]